MSFASSFMTSMALADSYRENLKRYQDAHPTAEDQGKTECCRSGVCCWRRPGSLNRQDVDNIAAFLNVTTEELFKEKLIVDKIRSTLTVLPKRKHQTGGEMISMEETYSFESPCVFLDTENNNACMVHDVKPTGCRNFKCWEEGGNEQEEWTEEEAKALGWNGCDPDDF